MSRRVETTLAGEADLLPGFAFKSSGYVADGTRLLRGDNIGQGVIRWDGAKRWKAAHDPELERYRLEPGDVVLAMDRPWIEAGLKFAAVTPSDVPCLLVQRVARLRGGRSLDTRFLRYLIASPAFTRHVLAVQTGTAVPHISGGQIGEFKFARPSIEEQRAIAATLGALDDKIELNRRMNESLEWAAEAIFRRMTSSAACARADDEFVITMGQSPPGETYNEIGAGTPFFQGRADFGFRYPTERVYCTASTRLASAGDTLVSVRAPVGDVNMALVDCAVGRGVAAVRHRSGSRSFTYYAMRGLRREFEVFESEGTVFGSLSKKDFHRLQVPAPAPAKVTRFEKLAGPLDRRIELNERESRTLAALRDALLPKLISGELRIRDAERAVEQAV